MHKCLTVAVIILLHTGCRDAAEQPDASHNQELPDKGKLLVPQDELPPRIVKLARMLERLPSITSDSEFRSTLVTAGLNRDPDHYKDFSHYWYLDQDFRSETDPKKRVYRVSIGHLPRPDSGIVFYYAAINREYSTAPWYRILWQADWPMNSLQQRPKSTGAG